MGKRKVQKNQPPPLGGQESNQGKKDDIKAGKKTYTLQKNKNEGENEDTTDLPKVRLPDKLENALIEMILEEQKSRKSLGDISKRITSKKLTDVYNSLSDSGFSKNQVEAAMSNTIMTGGDLIDALDWLCLNTQNDQLPDGFSETLQKEEEKRRPKFDRSLQVETKINPSTEAVKTPQAAVKPDKTSPPKPKNEKPGMKNWILQYAEQSSSESEPEEEDTNTSSFDPTARYAELHSKLQDLKDQAAIAKSNGATEKHKQFSKQLKELHLEMSSLEKYPEFDKSIKSQLKAAAQPAPKEQTKTCEGSKTTATEGKTEDDDGELGLGLFAQAEAEPAVKPVVVVQSCKEDVRSFEYTRAQWTGKSPKQFLIDWVRKHLIKSHPPKFKKIQVKVNRFKSTAIVQTKDGEMAVTPEILCENVKDAEHLASTLALYRLCKGQPVHQLLPPPYRNVWLDWADEEKKEKEDVKAKENKPRDQFISRLMKKLNVDDVSPKGGKESHGKSHPGGDGGDDDDEEEDDWESLADKGQLPEIAVTKTSNKKAVELEPRSVDSHLLKALQKRRETTEYQELLKTRQQLPVFQYREKLISAVRDHSVIVVAGETGSGKSTQVPQFILEESIERGHSNVHVVCTQPRRISATSLATRVSQEMGEGGLDAREALVGYQIRFESKRGPNTRLMYCTTGVVLRQLQNATDLKGVTHLVIDEVHERSVQSDFLMIVVKDILTRRPDLKVILMSATLDSAKFSSYFHHCPVIDIPGRTYPVEVFYLEDVIEMTGYVVDEDSQYTLNQKFLVKEDHATVEITQKGGDSSKQNLTWTQEDISRIDRTNLPADKYSLRTRNSVTRLNLNRINLDLICDLLKGIESSPPFSETEGAVLIFLPGLADIQELYEMLTTQRQFSNPSKYQIYALHSVLSSQDQGRVFSVPPAGIRKIVLATNIAETGITIPDVVFVIDSGKAKENRYMETSQMSALEEVFISKANCKQRSGRAGRVREGFCFRLYTQEQFKEFKAYTTPELLRVPLEELCLNIMKCQYGKPHEFLCGALDPPQASAVSRAVTLLKEVGAVQTGDMTLTPLGHHLAALPVDVRIGKMLILGAIFGCLEQIAVIAAAMTDKSPFVVPLSKRSEADTAKQAMAVAYSDHITLYKAYQGWYKARQDSRSAENSYCSKNFLKRATLQDIENVKKDLVKLVKSIGFDPSSSTGSSSSFSSSPSLPCPGNVLSISAAVSKSNDLDSSSIAMIKAVMTAGLYPQVGQVITTPSIDTTEKSTCLVETSQGVAQVHPSSVNKNLTSTGSWLVYHEKVRLSRVYLRDTSVVSPYALLLFGGAIDVQHSQRIVSLDGWIKYKAMAKTGVIFKELRVLLDSVLERKLKDPTMNISGSRLISLLKDMIGSEKSR